MKSANQRPLTMVEKLLSGKVGAAVKPGQVLPVEADYAMATDGSAPMAIDFFNQLESGVKFPERILFFEDHYVPCPNDKVAALLKKMEQFADRHKVKLYKEGEGICHRLMLEKGHVSPGSVVVGADSHSTTYGALNALGTGVGSSDFAGVMYTGQVWLKVPETINIQLEGELPPHVSGKDLALFIVGDLGSDGATYCTLEFGGSGLVGLDMEARITICNMVVETGGKNGIMPCDEVCREWIRRNPNLDDQVVNRAVAPDPGATYASTRRINFAELEPLLSAPHTVDNVQPVAQWHDKKIQMAVLGTCTNGSLDDLRVAANVLRNKQLAEGVRLLVIPPSRHVLQEAVKEGLISMFLEKGGLILPPGCGPCCGAMNGVPRDGEAVLSTANRNFIGRMGNTNSEVFLASPLTVAVSAVTGKITDPRSFFYE